MKHTARFSAVLTLMTLCVLPTLAGDWPQWRGPDRDGKSSETGLLKAWPDGGPPVLWKVEGLGGGYSGVSIAGGRIYTMGDLEDGQYVIGIKEDGGELVWKTRVGGVHEDKYGGPRSTPTIDDGHLYVVTTDGDVVCLETKSGREVWRRGLIKEYEGYLMRAMGSYEWKYSESPLVDGDRVIVTPGHVAAVLVALNKKTGEEVWRTQGTRLGARGADGAAYSSVVVSEALGRRQYVQLVGRGVIGVDAATGKILWGYNRVANDIANISTPLIHGNHVLASTGYGTGSGLIEIRPSQDEESDQGLLAHEVYFLEADTMQNHHGGLILHDGIVYTGTGHNKGLPIAVEFETGKVAWGPVRNEGQSSAAVTYADDRLYFRYQDGRVILVEANGKEYREHGSFLIPDVTNFSWAHPVIANGKMYLREQDRLYCHDITDAAPPG